MGDVINLRQVRKDKRRAEGQLIAETNRVKHGRTKAAKRLAETARKKHEAVMDGARRERMED